MSSTTVSGQVRPHILVLAYSISPVRGSEYSVGWNYVTNMAKDCDLTVLYGLAGPHMGDLEEIERFEAETGGLDNVTFEGIRPNVLARLLNAPNRKGFLVYSFYLAYRVWHWQAARHARQIIAQRDVDVVHYLCPIGYREPGYLWQINKPYIWGPVGGMVPTRLLEGAPCGWKARLKTKGKNLMNAWQLRNSHRVKRALRRADVVIAATLENQAVMRDRFGIDALQFAENAIPDALIDTAPPQPARAMDAPLRLIWIGSLDARKSPDLLIESVSALPANGWQLDIIGQGPLSGAVARMIAERGLGDRVRLHGQILRDQVHALLASADVHLITSMGEGNPTTIWEAMAAGIPTVTLDHCGMHDVICEACGIRVPLGSWEETCDAFGAAVSGLLDDPAGVAALKAGTCHCRDSFRWSKRRATWLDLYQQAITRHAAKKQEN